MNRSTFSTSVKERGKTQTTSRSKNVNDVSFSSMLGSFQIQGPPTTQVDINTQTFYHGEPQPGAGPTLETPEDEPCNGTAGASSWEDTAPSASFADLDLDVDVGSSPFSNHEDISPSASTSIDRREPHPGSWDPTNKKSDWVTDLGNAWEGGIDALINRKECNKGLTESQKAARRKLQKRSRNQAYNRRYRCTMSQLNERLTKQEEETRFLREKIERLESTNRRAMQSEQSAEADRRQRSEGFYRLLLRENMRLRRGLDGERQRRDYLLSCPSGVGQGSTDMIETTIQPSHPFQSGNYMGSQPYPDFQGYGQQPSGSTGLDFSLMDEFDFDLQLP